MDAKQPYSLVTYHSGPGHSSQGGQDLRTDDGPSIEEWSRGQTELSEVSGGGALEGFENALQSIWKQRQGRSITHGQAIIQMTDAHYSHISNTFLSPVARDDATGVLNRYLENLRLDTRNANFEQDQQKTDRGIDGYEEREAEEGSGRGYSRGKRRRIRYDETFDRGDRRADVTRRSEYEESRQSY